MTSKPRILITGGAGFIGHHLVHHILRNTTWDITVIDRLDISGNLNRLTEIGVPDDRLRFVYHDLRAEINPLLARQIGYHDYVVHMAAATHVERSIECPMDFVLNNVVATCNILDHFRKHGCRKFLYFSTDEVFGPAPAGVAYKENDRYNSGNPYAATKAGAEELCVAYQNTYNMPIIITHSMNIFGERQHPEKFIPLAISKVYNGDTVTIHANKDRTKAGSRFYTYAGDIASAVTFLLTRGESGQKYNIVGEQEVDNLEVLKAVAHIMGRPFYYDMVDFHSSRPGHDLRYALDATKMDNMGWTRKATFLDSLKQVVEWSLAHPHWLM